MDLAAEARARALVTLALEVLDRRGEHDAAKERLRAAIPIAGDEALARVALALDTRGDHEGVAEVARELDLRRALGATWLAMAEIRGRHGDVASIAALVESKDWRSAWGLVAAAMRALVRRGHTEDALAVQALLVPLADALAPPSGDRALPDHVEAMRHAVRARLAEALALLDACGPAAALLEGLVAAADAAPHANARMDRLLLCASVGASLGDPRVEGWLAEVEARHQILGEEDDVDGYFARDDLARRVTEHRVDALARERLRPLGQRELPDAPQLQLRYFGAWKHDFAAISRRALLQRARELVLGGELGAAVDVAEASLDSPSTRAAASELVAIAADALAGPHTALLDRLVRVLRTSERVPPYLAGSPSAALAGALVRAGREQDALALARDLTGTERADAFAAAARELAARGALDAGTLEEARRAIATVRAASSLANELEALLSGLEGLVAEPQ